MTWITILGISGMIPVIAMMSDSFWTAISHGFIFLTQLIILYHVKPK